MNGTWTRPARLHELAARLPVSSAEPYEAWSRVVARCRASTTVARLERTTLDAALATDAVLIAAEDAWPAEYVEAFERLGYGDRYGTEADTWFHAVSNRLDEAQLQGLVNSVKGTVMEIRVREMLQAGELGGVPEGGRVELAESLTQGGHDATIFDADGAVVSQFQVKSGQWAGVSARLDEYADAGIPVAVTTEAATMAEGAGRADDVIDTGVSSVELTEEAADIIDNLGLGQVVGEFLPEFALIALLGAAGLRLRAGQNLDEVKGWLTKELKECGVANAAGVAVQMLTGVAVLRPLAVLGSRWGIARASTSAEAAATLQRVRERMREIKADSNSTASRWPCRQSNQGPREFRPGKRSIEEAP